MGTDDEGHKYERKSVRGEREERPRSILKTVGTGENVVQGYQTVQEYENILQARGLPVHRRLPVQGGKGWRVQKARMDNCGE